LLLTKQLNKQRLAGGNALSLGKESCAKKPAFVPVKAANAKRNKAADCRFRAGSFAADLCAPRTGKSQKNYRKTSLLVLSEFFWLFLCPEALFAPFKLQAQFAGYCIQAGSPAKSLCAAFFRKRVSLPVRFRFAGSMLQTMNSRKRISANQIPRE